MSEHRSSAPSAARPSRRRASAYGLLLLAAIVAGCASRSRAPGPPAPGAFGVLVMAHGGSPEWNDGVLAAVAPLRDELPLEVAFGMADATTIQEAVHRLEIRGVRRIAVVRLFVSGESWRDRTEQILGIRPGAPERSSAEPAAPGHDHDHSMGFWRLDTSASFALSTTGLAEAPTMGPVLADRAVALSRSPASEDVLILSHGPGDDDENERWLAQLEARAQAVRERLPFRRVEVETLREDWPDKREEAERRIRRFVERARVEDGAALVIPFRVHGFGPYAEVLAGLEYRADGHGLIPHPNVTAWIREQIELLRAGAFASPVARDARSGSSGGP